MKQTARRGACPQQPDASAQLTLGFDQRPFDIAVIHQATGIYTAAGEVDALLERLHWPAEGDRLLDPGGGNGGILVRALRRLALACDDVAAAVRRVRGFEFYPGAVAEARRAVRDHLAGRGWSAPAAERAAMEIVEERDFLLAPVRAGVFDLVVMNPPYMRLANLPDGYRADYEAVVAAHARGDMLYAYLQRAADILAPGGRIGLISADRWLLNNGSAELRRRLGELFRVTDLCRLDAESAFYSAKDRRQGTPPRVHAVRVVLDPGDVGRHLDASPFRLEPLPDVDGTALGDIADIEVRIAPRLGPAGIFLVSKADKLPAFEVDSAGMCTVRLVPAVEPRDIDGDTIRPARRWALVTTEAEPGAVILEHLDATLHRMPARGRRRACRWLPPETFTGRLPLDHDAVLVPRIARSLKAVVLPAGRLPVNHSLVVVSGRPAAEIIAMLSDPAVQTQAEALAPRVEGGYRSYTTYLLRQLVIPRGYLTAGLPRPS